LFTEDSAVQCTSKNSTRRDPTFLPMSGATMMCRWGVTKDRTMG